MRRKFQCMNYNQQNIYWFPNTFCYDFVGIFKHSVYQFCLILPSYKKKIKLEKHILLHANLMCMQNSQSRLNQNLFRIQVKKSFSPTSSSISGKLSLFYIEKKNMMCCLPAQSTVDIKEWSKIQKITFDFLCCRNEIAKWATWLAED